MKPTRFLSAFAFLGTMALIASPYAAGAKPFFKGKRITMLINYGPGGGADRSGRVIARHLPRLIEGNPKIIAKNLPGAGGLIAINFIGEAARKDGLTISNFSGGYLFQLMEDPSLRVDLRKVEWVAGVGGTSILYARTDTKPGLKSPLDLWKVVEPSHFKIAGYRINNTKDIRDRLAFRMLKIKHMPVTGFRGTTKARTALMQNEVQAFTDSRAAWFKTIVPNMINTGTALPIYHYDYYDLAGNPGPYPDIAGKVLSLSELYKKRFGKMPSGFEWEAISLIQRLHGVMARNTMMPPGTPKEAVAEMRQAYMKLAKDPAYLADAKKSLGFVPEFTPGEEIAKLIKGAFTGEKNEVRKKLLAFVESQKKKKR